MHLSLTTLLLLGKSKVGIPCVLRKHQHIEFAILATSRRRGTSNIQGT